MQVCAWQLPFSPDEIPSAWKFLFVLGPVDKTDLCKRRDLCLNFAEIGYTKDNVEYWLCAEPRDSRTSDVFQDDAPYGDGWTDLGRNLLVLRGPGVLVFDDAKFRHARPVQPDVRVNRPTEAGRLGQN